MAADDYGLIMDGLFQLSFSTKPKRTDRQSVVRWIRVEKYYPMS